MANNTHPPPSPPQGFLHQAQRVIPTLLLTVAVAFGTSWWNSQLALNDLKYRLDRLEEKQKDQAATMAASAQTAQQNAIRLAELGVVQTSLAEQLKEIKAENERLLRR